MDGDGTCWVWFVGHNLVNFSLCLCFQLYLERGTVTSSFSLLSSDVVAPVCVFAMDTNKKDAAIPATNSRMLSPAL